MQRLGINKTSFSIKLDHGPEKPRISTSKNRRRQQTDFDFEWWSFDTEGTTTTMKLAYGHGCGTVGQMAHHISPMMQKTTRPFKWTNCLSCMYEYNKPELCINWDRTGRHRRWLRHNPLQKIITWKQLRCWRQCNCRQQMLLRRLIHTHPSHWKWSI
jgi:hypothetical protein